MNRKDKALEFTDETYNIQITGRNVEVTDAIRDYATEKVSKIERFMSRIIDVNVIMDIQRLDHRVEIIVKTGNTKITSSASTTDMYASIDQAVAKLEAQLLRYKSKLQDHHAKGHAILDMNVNVLSREEAREEELEEEIIHEAEKPRFKLHHVVKKETRPLKTLTYDEAVMKMELSGDTFMVFKNEEDQKLKVIYRRRDDNYGIIEPAC